MAGCVALSVAGIGCEVDCEEQYCKFVRAGQSGVFAYHYMCCVEPDAATCDEYAERVHGFSQRAAEMYVACGDRDWDRLGVIWREIKSLLPLGVVAIIADDFCDGYGWRARNRWTPFDGDDLVDIDVRLEPRPMKVRVHTGVETTPLARRSSAPAELVRRWRIADGSEVFLDLGDSMHVFDFEGELQATEGAVRLGMQEVDVSSWCRNLEVEKLEWRLRSDARDVELSLVPESRLNRIHAIDEGRFLLGALVHLRFVERVHDGLEFDGELEEVFLEIPCTFDEDGSLRIATDGEASAMSIWPVGSALEWYLGGASTTPATEEIDHNECIRQAREMADYFGSIHDCP